MIKIKLLPQKGIIINEDSIFLGMNISEIKLNYEMQKYESIYYLFENSLQIETNNNIVYSICCCIDIDSPVDVIFLGNSLRNLEVDKVINMLNASVHETASVYEDEHTYVWFKSGLSCWRMNTPAEIVEMINESKKDGTYEDMQDDIEKDEQHSKFFDTISIARKEIYEKLYLMSAD